VSRGHIDESICLQDISYSSSLVSFSFLFFSIQFHTINSIPISNTIQSHPKPPTQPNQQHKMAVDMELPQTRRRADSRRGNDQADWVWKAPRPDFVRGADEPEEAWHARVNADAQRLMKAYDVVHEAEGGEKEPQRRVRVQREYDTALLLGDKLQVYYKENSAKLGNTDAARDTLKAICDKFAKVQEDRQRQDVRSRKSAETKSHGKPKYERRKSGPPAEKESSSDEDAPQPAHKALSVLKALQDRADHGEYYSRGASDSLAQAWADGDRKTTKYTPSNRRHEEVTRAELISMENAEAKSASGVTLQVALDDFKRCAEIIKQLGDNINEDLDAEETYDAYDDVHVLLPARKYDYN
jgi:hypothetical protein